MNELLDLHLVLGALSLMSLAFAVGIYVGHMLGYKTGYNSIEDKEQRARAVDASLRKSAARAGKATRKGARSIGYKPSKKP